MTRASEIVDQALFMLSPPLRDNVRIQIEAAIKAGREWQPIETAPESEPILVFSPKANRGRDSCEVVIIYRMEDGEIHWWTNGGANAGSDLYYDDDERPTHWMPLPTPPANP